MTLAVAVHNGDHIQGNARAACTLVEYGDYQCPSCGQAYPIVKRVQERFGDQLRFVFRNFPLEQHPYAEPAAETAEFAAAHGKFWEMHDALYENQSRLGDDLLGELTKTLGLDPEALAKSLQSGEFEPRVEADLESGERSGVRGTPTFYINGTRHNGGYDAASLMEAIEGELRR